MKHLKLTLKPFLYFLLLFVFSCTKSVEDINVTTNESVISIESNAAVSNIPPPLADADEEILLTQGVVNTVTRNQWKTFEDNVEARLKLSKGPISAQVALDVTINTNGVIKTTRIIADVITKDAAGIYRIYDAKVSGVKDLATIANLNSVCTVNQKVVYPAINLVPGKGSITKVIVVAVYGENSLGLISTPTLGSDITSKLFKQIKSGVLLYVTNPKGNYIGTPLPRNIVL
jgi:hypothetical protein